MNDRLNTFILEWTSQIIGYFPKLLAGIALLAVGWLLAWFVKRLAVQLSVILRLDRLLRRTRWQSDFERADVRYGFYNFIGNIFFLVVFLIFLDFSLLAWDLKLLSDLVGKGILLVPRLLGAAVIFGFGWLTAIWSAMGLLRVLKKENLPHASLIAQFAKIALIVFFSAMALVELNFAREVVLIGFSTVFIVFGIIAIMLVAIRAKSSEVNGEREKVKDEEE